MNKRKIDSYFLISNKFKVSHISFQRSLQVMEYGFTGKIWKQTSNCHIENLHKCCVQRWSDRLDQILRVC